MKRKGSDESAEHVIQIKEEEGEKAEVVKDPVCGMEVRTPEKALSAEYEGKVYYFCSNYCQKTFKKTPKAYVPYDPSEYEEIKGYMQ
ncbi:MAG: YHS domain-containing protein [wastewater metagenome]|nr:YHS domain-containing protein [Candidatus Loosdrechtia aerotolerans]